MPTFFFAGGGTGGHLYPGMAIAEQLREQSPAAQFIYLCSRRPIDARILASQTSRFHALNAQPFSLHPRRLARFAWHWGGAVRETRRLIRAERERGGPVVMVAMGGFVAAPAAQAALVERLPIALINLDAVPGKANRWIARRATIRLTVTGAKAPPEWERIAPIVRRGAVATDSAAACRRRLGLAEETPTLFVTGGSQGAGTINGLLVELLRRSPGAFAGWQVIHQSGAGADGDVAQAYERAGVRAVVRAFFENVGDAWGAADLAVSRSGAGSVAEAWASRTPALFLPYPYHRDEHQRWNAMPLAEAGGAVIERDLIEPARNVGAAGARILELLADRPKLLAMTAAMEKLGPADGAAAAARRILALIR